MENYRKGKNVEEPLERNKIPIANLPADFLWMQVRGGSKIRILLKHALNEFPEVKHVVWTGYGTSVGKAITCAEIMKRECDNSLHQITRLNHRLVDEYWDPIIPELDQIIVKRKLPLIHIYLSRDMLDANDLGYQAPGVFIPYSQNGNDSSNGKRPHKQVKYNKRNTDSSNVKVPKQKSRSGISNEN